MYKTRLEMGFKDIAGKNFKVSIENPRENLENEDVKKTMDLLLEKDVFRNKNRSLESIENARIVKTEIEEFFL